MTVTASDILLYISTDLSSTNIALLITDSTNELTQRLGGASINSNDQDQAIIYLTCIKLANRMPTKYSMDGISMDQGTRIKDWRKAYLGILRRTVDRWIVSDSTEE